MIMNTLSENDVNSKLPRHVKVAIIGGGVVGCSILFHLAKFGWKDVVLLERKELTSGSSWHAAGQIHTISSDPNISRLQSYTINLYKEIEKTSGQSVGLHSTGGFYLASNEQWHDYLKRERSKARYMGLDQEFISLDEVARRHPLIDPSRYIAALWDPLDGDIDPSGVTYAFAKAAKVYGASYITQNPVIEMHQRADASWDVVTQEGTVHAEIVVNAAGLWAREVGKMAGIDLPVQPMEHHYLITETIPEIAERSLDNRLPAGIDYEANIYFRQERQGMLLGTYEPSATPWKVEGTPLNFDHELLPPALDRIADRLEIGFGRIPALERAGIKNIVNGPFTFGPDGNPMIGPVPGMQNYWVAVGVMAGFCQGGGVGLSIAEWMIDGAPSIDVWAMDIARFGNVSTFGNFATPGWGTIKSTENYERRFVMTFPNETLPKGRKQKTTAIYHALNERGAVWGQVLGLEHALWFANGKEDAYEIATFKRSRAHSYVQEEVAAVRQKVGAIEIANFSKHHFKGAKAREVLDRIMAGKVPQEGRLALSPMLSAAGKLLGDLSIACLGLEEFMVFGSGAAQEMHRRWFEQNILDDEDVYYKNCSDDWHGLAISGPQSRALVQKLTRVDMSSEAFKFLDGQKCYVADVPVILLRVSFSGELGYEIYCAPHYLLRLSEAIEDAGEEFGLKWYGARALLALRLEKGWGVWGLDYRPDFTAHESGLDVFIQWNKNFIGKHAALEHLKSNASKKLSLLIVHTKDIDVSNDEAILYDGRAIGHVTSGGYAHHIQQSLAMGYIESEFIKAGQKVQIEINGKLVEAEVTLGALYDPNGIKIRE